MQNLSRRKILGGTAAVAGVMAMGLPAIADVPNTDEVQALCDGVKNYQSIGRQYALLENKWHKIYHAEGESVAYKQARKAYDTLEDKYLEAIDYVQHYPVQTNAGLAKKAKLHWEDVQMDSCEKAFLSDILRLAGMGA